MTGARRIVTFSLSILYRRLGYSLLGALEQACFYIAFLCQGFLSKESLLTLIAKKSATYAPYSAGLQKERIYLKMLFSKRAGAFDTLAFRMGHVVPAAFS